MLSPYGGFMDGSLGEGGLGILPIGRGIYQPPLTRALSEKLEAVERGDFGGQDPAALMAALNIELMQNIMRSQTVSGVPTREDLEAEVTQIIPVNTPMRNRLPRTTGSGSASSWDQQTALGGGYGVATTVTTGASSATQTVGSTAGMQAGMSLYFQTSNAYRVVSSVTSATVVVLTATISTTTAEAVAAGPYYQPGQGPIQAFFAETGAPANASPTYAKKTSNYKLLGTMFDITGFAMAAGASFDNQLAMEKVAAIRRLMLIEENALINADSSIVTAPWGDGTNALGFDGLLVSISAANGTPVPQLQTNVGALTTAHMDAQIARQHNTGGMNPYIEINAQEAISLLHLAEASGSIIRLTVTDPSKIVLGGRVGAYMSPVTGELIPIEVSKFMPAGTMVFGSDQGPDGKVAADVRVLPQVQLPQLAPNVNIQGYVAQELAPAVTSPQKYPGLVSVFEVFRMKNSTVFCKSTGVTAV